MANAMGGMPFFENVMFRARLVLRTIPQTRLPSYVRVGA